MKSRKRYSSMSTDRKPKKKRSFLYAERFQILEYGLIGLLVLLFAAGALYYGLKHKDAPASVDAASFPSPEPTADPSVRGMNVLAALENAEIAVALTDDGYTLTAPNGVSIAMLMESDDRGIRVLSFETLLCPDPTEDSAVAAALREENARSVEALRTVFDAVMPVFSRSVADSETVVKQCRTVVEKGTPYAKKLGDYSVRIRSDLDALPQSVVITFTRNQTR